MFGVGYDYGTQYAVLHGDTVGALPVGMQSNEERDAPFWPQANNCTYKEIWMGPPGKWLAMMADEYLPAHITGDTTDVVNFEHDVTAWINSLPALRFQPSATAIMSSLP